MDDPLTAVCTSIGGSHYIATMPSRRLTSGHQETFGGLVFPSPTDPTKPLEREAFQHALSEASRTYLISVQTRIQTGIAVGERKAA